VNENERQQALHSLKRIPKVSELYHVETFRAYRENKQGGETPITIEIWDRGERDSRWTVTVRDNQGRVASGNPHENLDAALHIVHWGDLDEEL